MGRFSRKKEKSVFPANAPPTGQPPNCPPAPPMNGHYQTVMPSMEMPTKPWDGTTFKIQLKMAKNRLQIQRGKKENEIDSSRRTIAQHLSSNKVTLARIQAERVLREQNQIRAFDIIETMVELLANSNNAIGMHRMFDSLPGDVKEAAASVIYTANKLNIPELQTVLNILRGHFGAGVVDSLIHLQGPYVIHINKLLATSLDGQAPDGYLIMEELTKVAAEHNVNWIPPAEPEALDSHSAHYQHGQGFPPPGPNGGGGPGMGFGGGGYPHPQVAPSPYDFGPPSNIPGMSGPPDPMGMPWTAGASSVPSAPPAPSAPPFNPGAGMGGSYYPPVHRDIKIDDNRSGLPAPSAPPAEDLRPSAPPPPPDMMSGPPGADFLSDDVLEAKLRNLQDIHKRQ